ncbi:MAG: GNAT family N-acetyltransferase [Acidimicrobiia bacterium]|jgi:ribosomal protein S18 acetylase RimI-like enzyme|nr:GNAT family N-acetyltransferase [Acidimicrobiia bacterium]
MPVTVTIAATDEADELVAALERLVPQLSRSNPPPTPEQVGELLGAPATDQFVARDEGGAIVGVATLATFRIPTGVRAWIEDVIVDESARSQGVGESLTRAMLDRASGHGAVTVDLTSRPDRAAANRLYVRIGFQRRETNVYRYDLTAE